MIEKRGKPITCRYCGKQFKIENIIEKKQWETTNCICPFCGEEWCILPKTERNLKYLQQIYLQTRQEKDFVNLLRLIYKYTGSLIKKKYSAALKFEGALDYYTNEVITIITEEYLRKPEWEILTSFGGFIILKIRQAIYTDYDKKDKKNKNISLDFKFDDDENDLYDLIPSDAKNDLLYKIEEEEDTKFLYNKIEYITEGIVEYCNSYYEDFIRTISFSIYLKKGEKHFDRFFQNFGRDGKLISLKTLDILKNELLKDSLIENRPVY